MHDKGTFIGVQSGSAKQKVLPQASLRLVIHAFHEMQCRYSVLRGHDYKSIIPDSQVGSVDYAGIILNRI